MPLFPDESWVDGSLQEPGLLPVRYGNNVRGGICPLSRNQWHRGIQHERRGSASQHTCHHKTCRWGISSRFANSPVGETLDYHLVPSTCVSDQGGGCQRQSFHGCLPQTWDMGLPHTRRRRVNQPLLCSIQLDVPDFVFAVSSLRLLSKFRWD